MAADYSVDAAFHAGLALLPGKGLSFDLQANPEQVRRGWVMCAHTQWLASSELLRGIFVCLSFLLFFFSVALAPHRAASHNATVAVV